MGVPGAVQVRVKSPRGVDGAEAGGAIVSSWTMPIYGVVMRSPSVMWGTGDGDDNLVLMRTRIAETLGIRSGDIVEFDLVDVGDTVELPVKVMDTISSDILIHDWFTLGLATQYSADSRNGESVVLTSGKTMKVPVQELWAGIRMVEYKGTVCLHFDGVSRGMMSKGQAGYAFRITVGDDGAELIRGYGYGGGDRTSAEMEYTGLYEGLIWALRLDTKLINICSDSKLILGQLFEQFPLEGSEITTWHAKVVALLDKMPKETTIAHSYVPREDNRMSELMANLGIDSRENFTVCNWNNVNNFKYRR
jgi:ribonuclease HI